MGVDYDYFEEDECPLGTSCLTLVYKYQKKPILETEEKSNVVNFLNFFRHIEALALMCIDQKLTERDFELIFMHPNSRSIRMFEADSPSKQQIITVFNKSEYLTSFSTRYR